MDILIYCPKCTPRIDYVVQVIFDGHLGTSYQLTDDREYYRSQSPGFRVNYGYQRLRKDEVFLPASSLLFEENIRPQHTRLVRISELPALFPVQMEGADLSFDIFSAVFYLLSRYEEYLPYEKDVHGRFPATQSIAFREGFLQVPLVDQWIERLRDLLKRKFPDLNTEKHPYSFVPTFDVDLAWAFRHRPLWRKIGGYGKSLIRADWQALINRWQVERGRKADPFDTFSYLTELHSRYGLEPVFFFLVGDYGPFDKNIDPRREPLRQLIREVARNFPTGIHPSYRSNSSPAILQREVRRMSSITGAPVIRSRQHFLKLSLPGTYQQLIEAGIQADYTMGYADQAGFRAGTAIAFPWYDLSREISTGLMIHPFQVMDVTLKNYLGLSPEEAIDYIAPLILATRDTGGTFCTLWHNSSLSYVDGWDEWRVVYEGMVALAEDGHLQAKG